MRSGVVKSHWNLWSSVIHIQSAGLTNGTRLPASSKRSGVKSTSLMNPYGSATSRVTSSRALMNSSAGAAQASSASAASASVNSERMVGVGKGMDALHRREVPAA